VECDHRHQSNQGSINLAAATSELEKHEINITWEEGKSDVTRLHVTPEISESYWHFRWRRRLTVNHGAHGGNYQPGDDVSEERISSRRPTRQRVVRRGQEGGSPADWARPRSEDRRPQLGDQRIPGEVLVA